MIETSQRDERFISLHFSFETPRKVENCKTLRIKIGRGFYYDSRIFLKLSELQNNVFVKKILLLYGRITISRDERSKERFELNYE